LGFDQTQMRDLFNVFLTGQGADGRRPALETRIRLSLGEGQSARSAATTTTSSWTPPGTGSQWFISGTLFPSFENACCSR
jgi:hypothetical protein